MDGATVTARVVVCAALMGATSTSLAAARSSSRRAIAGERARMVWLARLRRKQRERCAERALPIVLEAVARSLRGGVSLRVALVEGTATAPQECESCFSTLGELAAGGLPLADAADAWFVERGDSGTRLAAAAIRLAASAGGGAARSLDGVAATLRERLALAGDVRALAVQARLSATVVALAPLVFAALAAGVDERTATFLIAEPAGWLCLAGGLALDGAGFAWMRRIVARVGEP